MHDSYGDGWHGGLLTIAGQSFGSGFSYGYEWTDEICLEDGCYDYSFPSGTSWLSEITWDLTDADGNIVMSGAAPDSGNTCIGGSEPESVCDGDIYGVYMFDSWGDGWHGNTIAINGEQFGADFTTGTEAYDEVCLAPACYDVTVGMNDGSGLENGSWQNEISW